MSSTPLGLRVGFLGLRGVAVWLEGAAVDVFGVGAFPKQKQQLEEVFLSLEPEPSPNKNNN